MSYDRVLIAIYAASVRAGIRNPGTPQSPLVWTEHEMEATRNPVRQHDTSALRISRFDRVAGMLVALLILSGVAVGGMFIVWLTAAELRIEREGVSVQWLGDITFDPPNPNGDLEPLGRVDDVPLETSIKTLTDAASRVAVLDVQSGPFPSPKSGGPHGRPLGPPSAVTNAVPRWERWEIRFESSSINAYARQLDYFKIELGAVGGGRSQIDYAYNLTKTRPDTKLGSGKNERRLYMTWRDGTLREFDHELLGRAGIKTTNRMAMQFYPQEVEDRLALIEKENADRLGKTLPEYLKTVFRAEAAGSGWTFTVVEQRFRPKPK
jgi:hypothetical protein